MLLGTPDAAAQALPLETVDDADSPKRRARRLAQEGAEAYESGDYGTAFEKLEKAETLVPVPTIGIEVARTLVELKRLRDALAAYARVEAMTIPDDMPERFKRVQRQRQADARAERERLEVEMPRIALNAVGAVPDELRVDGEAVSLESRSVTLDVDPGRHEVMAERGAEHFRQEVRVGRGGKVVVELRFGERLSPPSTPLSKEPADLEGDDGSRPLLVPLGWTAVGLGAASLVVSGTTFARASSLKGDLDAQCPSSTCRSSQVGFDVADDIAAYDAFRTASVATLAAGAGLAVIGMGLLVTPLILDDASETTVSLGPSSVELRLRY